MDSYDSDNSLDVLKLFHPHPISISGSPRLKKASSSLPDFSLKNGLLWSKEKSKRTSRFKKSLKQCHLVNYDMHKVLLTK